VLYFFNGSTALADLSLISYVSRPHSVGLLWTSDRPVPKTSTWQKRTLKRDRHPCPQQDSNPQSHTAPQTHAWYGAFAGIREILYYST